MLFVCVFQASLCLRNLDNASDVVSEEMEKLDVSAEKCMDSISKTFAVSHSIRYTTESKCSISCQSIFKIYVPVKVIEVGKLMNSVRGHGFTVLDQEKYWYTISTINHQI